MTTNPTVDDLFEIFGMKPKEELTEEQKLGKELLRIASQFNSNQSN